MDVVTGSFGYIGRYITRHLLDRRREVRTVTTHPDKPNPFGSQVKAFPLDFSHPAELAGALRGASTLYNTYWIRFPFRGQTYEGALENTRILFRAAGEAGVKRIVHVSVTRASSSSDLPYYRGKGLQEEMLAQSGVPWAVVRPTLVFGREDILLNNIAWMLRRFPAFPVFGSGRYRLQPVFVGDLAKIAAGLAESPAGTIADAAGPDTFTFEDLLRLLRRTLGLRTALVRVPPAAGILGGRILGSLLGDVVLTPHELVGLMREYLTSEREPAGTTRLSDWLAENREAVGRSYASEIGRHFAWKAE